MKCSYYAAEQGPKNLGSLYSKTIFVVSKDISVCINVHSNKTKKHKNPIVNTDQAINAGLKCLYRRESKGKRPTGNESVPIQLAQCWFPGLAISNDKI